MTLDYIYLNVPNTRYWITKNRISPQLYLSIWQGISWSIFLSVCAVLALKISLLHPKRVYRSVSVRFFPGFKRLAKYPAAIVISKPVTLYQR